MKDNKINLDTLKEDDFKEAIVDSVFATCNNQRETFRVEKLFRDEIAEIAIKDYFFAQKDSEEELDTLIKERNVIYKNIQKIFLSKQYQNASTNTMIYQNFLRLFEENCQSSSSPFLSANCFTHIGVGINFIAEQNLFQICVIFTQKSLAQEHVLEVKDGFIIRGKILEPNVYLYGVRLVKNANQVPVDVGPGKISFNRTTGKFVIVVKGTGTGLGIRKIWYFVTNSDDVPYLNPIEQDVNWDVLEAALVTMVLFSKIPDKKKSELCEKYLQDDFSFAGVGNMDTNINNINNISNSNNLNNINPVKPMSYAEKRLSAAGLINANKGTRPGGSSFFTPSNNFTNKQFPPNNTILEENTRFSETSNFNSIKKMNNNLTGFMSNNKSLGLFSENDNQMIKNNIGNRLEQAQAIKNSRFNPVFDSKPSGVSIGVNKPTTSRLGAATGTSKASAGFRSFLQNQKTGVVTGNNNTNTALNNDVFMKTPVSNSNKLDNFTVAVPNKPNSILKKRYTNPCPVTCVQTMPLNPKSLMDLKPNISNKNFWNPSNTQITQTNSHFVPLSIKDPNFHINLAKDGKYVGNNIQSIMIKPQTRKEFLEIIKRMLNSKTNPLFNLYLQNDLNMNNMNNMNNNQNNNVQMKEENKFNFLNQLNTSSFSPKVNQYRETYLGVNLNVESSMVNYMEGKRQPRVKFFKEGNQNSNKNNNLIYDKNIYNIDYYIFKEALNQNNLNNQNNQNIQNNQNNYREPQTESTKSKVPCLKSRIIEEENKQMNEKILDTLSKRYLKDFEIRPIYNQVFEELYKTMSCYDIIISIKGEDIHAHKVVLISQSQMFKEMIQKNEVQGNQYGGQNKSQELIKIVLPENMFKSQIFKETLKWIYCSRISPNLDLNFLREMLITADNLKIFSLQRILIVKYIIPNLEKEISIKFLKDSYNKATNVEVTDVWSLLANFSLNCLAKNSSILIKNNRNEFLGMELDLLFKCVEQSVFYLVEEIHLSNLIKLIIDRGFATDVFDLLNKLSKNYMNARNYSIQNIDLSEFISKTDHSKPIETFLITESLFEKKEEKSNNILNNESKINLPLQQNEDNKNCELGKNKVEIIDLKKLPNTNLPSGNHINNIDIKKGKQATFSFKFQLNNNNLNNNDDSGGYSSCSIFSETFNTNSHSWQIKIDISSIGEVSFYIIERGHPIIQDSRSFSKFQLYQDKFSLRFNSILFEFEIKDISFNKSGVIFFSFVSNQHQIIGYENFFNIKQLGKKENFVFNIWIKEFPIHSACLQYVCDNFQSLAIGVKKNNENPSSNSNSNPNPNSNNNQNITNEMKSFYDLNPHDLTYILYSDHLKVDNENTVITAIYRYSLYKNINDIEWIMNTLRYKFIDMKLLCATARDHDVIKSCQTFKRHFYLELDRRKKKINVNKKGEIIKTTKSNILSEIFRSEENNSKKKKKEFKFNQNKRRNFYNFNVENDQPFNITSDLTSFFLEKEHHSGYIKEIERVSNYKLIFKYSS
jgi:hypothetical protein